MVLICVSQNSAFASFETIKVTAPWNSRYNSIKVAIINEAGLTEDKISVVKRAINSEANYTLDGHPYFVGWQGALRSIQATKNTEFKILESDNKDNVNADIVIRLLKSEGSTYSGLTKPIFVENKIQLVSINIFKSNDISSMQLENLVRHEFGHALGLGHSTDQNSIMYELIEPEAKLITDCDLSGLQALDTGHVFTNIGCNDVSSSNT